MCATYQFFALKDKYNVKLTRYKFSDCHPNTSWWLGSFCRKKLTWPKNKFNMRKSINDEEFASGYLSAINPMKINSKWKKNTHSGLKHYNVGLSWSVNHTFLLLNSSAFWTISIFVPWWAKSNIINTSKKEVWLSESLHIHIVYLHCNYSKLGINKDLLQNPI